MRPLSLPKSAISAANQNLLRSARESLRLLATLGALAILHGCSQSSGAGAGTVAPPSPFIQVTVNPPTSSVILGNTQTFAATVTGISNTAIAWSVNGVPGGNATSGTITTTGTYTAPEDLPSPASVQITATSTADPTKSATATVSIISDIVVQVTPNIAGVELGALQPFSATILSAGHPDPTLRWSISGAPCPNQCGTVDAHGNFTAPQILPSPASLTVTAQSVADPSKQASAAITITSHFSLTVSAPANVPTGASAAIVATLTPAPNSNPSQALSWALSGPGCNGSSCGTLTTITSQVVGANPQSSVATSSTATATYTAPSSAPSPNTVTISVTAQADPSKQAQATLAIAQGAGVSITPLTATLAANHRVTLTPQITGSANANVLWNVNGIPGGNATLGQICVQSSSPCQPALTASSAPVDYLAPGAIPTPNPLTVQAVSAADATKNASAQITVINHVLVSVLPSGITLAPAAVQGFTASVLGSANQQVVWQISGAACSGGTGQGSGVCGIIDTSGTYTAPSAPPSPDALQVIAVSQDDASQSGAANVTISTGANISSLHPASVYAGAAQGFTLQVDGSGFIANASGASSAIVIAGSARTTTCASSTRCLAPVTASDVSTAGTVSVQIENPGGPESNAVDLVVAAPNSSDASITLTASAPGATGQNIVVVDSTTAGISTANDDVDLNLAAIGAFSTVTNSCTLGGNPVTFVRPASGSSTADLCLFSESGLDASMTVAVSGPGDVTVISEQPAGLGILHVTLIVPAAAAPGPRTLFIQTTNLDKTSASGAVILQ
jgi:hypothetical protein